MVRKKGMVIINLIATQMNNARNHLAAQPTVPLPAWGDESSGQLGYDAQQIIELCNDASPGVRTQVNFWGRYIDELLFFTLP